MINVKWRRWSFFWGAWDLLFVATYIVVTSLGRHLPIYHEFETAEVASITYGSDMPWAFAAIDVAFYILVAISGIFLMRGARLGRYLAYIQAPIRIGLATPSLFPLAYLFSKERGLLFSLALLLSSEAIKVLTLMREVSKSSTV